MTRRQPPGGQAPVVQKIRLRYAKRGPLRFTSHRDFARAFERALRRADVPIAYSQGFTPHPKISYASASPTGAASEAEYLELGLRDVVDPEAVRSALDAVLPPGLDVLEAVAVAAPPPGGALPPGEAPVALPDRLTGSAWTIELPGVPAAEVDAAVAAFLTAETVEVERLTKQGRRRFDTRGPVLAMITRAAGGAAPAPCAIIDIVVRHATPAVRPDDVLNGLRAVGGLEPPVPPRVTRTAQGALTDRGDLVDPLAADRGDDIGERAVESPSR